jgi:hypothetical protein
MEIIFHAHHAAISPRLRQRADTSLRKIVARLGRTVAAVVRVEEDGPTRRVELVLLAARGRKLVARGEGRAFGPALTVALGRLGAQVAHAKGTRRAATARRRVAKSRERGKLLSA